MCSTRPVVLLAKRKAESCISSTHQRTGERKAATLRPYEEWWRNYYMVVDYERQHGTYDVPLEFVAFTPRDERVPLGTWLDSQIQALARLKPDRYDALKKLADTGRLWNDAPTISLSSDEHSTPSSSDESGRKCRAPSQPSVQCARVISHDSSSSDSDTSEDFRPLPSRRITPVVLRRPANAISTCDVTAGRVCSSEERPSPSTMAAFGDTHCRYPSAMKQVLVRHSASLAPVVPRSSASDGDIDESSSNGSGDDYQPKGPLSLSALESGKQGGRVVTVGRNPLQSGARPSRVKRSPYTRVRVHKGSVVAYAFRRPGSTDNVLGIGQVLGERSVMNAQALDKKLWEIQQMRVQQRINDFPDLLDCRFITGSQQHTTPSDRILHTRVELVDGRLSARTRRELGELIASHPLRLTI
eukprot:gene25399-31857_t